MHAPLPESQRGYPAARASRHRRLAAGAAVAFLVAGSIALFVLGTDDGPSPARVQQPQLEPAAPAAVPAPVVEFDIDSYGHRVPRRPTAKPTSPMVRKSGPAPAPVRKQTATVTRPYAR